MGFADVSDRSLESLLSLKGRVAVVTGAARGLGKAIALRLAEAGATLVIVDKNGPEASAVAKSIQNGGSKAISITADTRNAAEVNDAATQTILAFKQIDIWVNDAGIYPLKPALEITDEDWATVISTNLTGVFYGARAAAREMQIAGRPAVIINLASSLGYHGVKNQASYVATKFGVRGLTAALSVEWAEFGIRVLAIGPGFIDTPGMREAAADLNKLAPGGSAFEAYAKTNPSGRIGQPDDIARAVLFAASDAAMFMTGSTILVDGGEVASGGAA